MALGVVLAALLSAPVMAQKSYDDHELTDRFYITIGGFQQDDIRTTFRLDAKSGTGIGLGTVIALESLFELDSEVTAVRLDGWYRFNKKHRVSWTYFKSSRDGVHSYECDDPADTDCPIEIGDITIESGDTVTTDEETALFALSWSYSFLNTSKYEAWVGIGLNFSSVDLEISTTVSGLGGGGSAAADATIPLPVINYGGRWNFSKRTRLLFFGQILDLEVGDYEGRLSNTRLLAEFDITKNFGIGGGFERYNFEVTADDEDFRGEMDTSYSALSLYIKGQF